MASVLDEFTRANETPLAAGWKGPVFSGDNQLELNNNRANGKSTGWSNSYWNTKFAANQVVQYEIAAKVTSRAFELLARLTNPGGSISCYYCEIDTTTGEWELGSVKAGVEATIKKATKAIALTDKVRMECNGTTIKCIHETSAGVKTTVIEVTNSTVTGEGFIGAAVLGQSLEMAFDNFFGGALTSEVIYVDTPSGKVNFVGSKEETKVTVDTPSGKINVVGSVTEAYSIADSIKGTINIVGTCTESNGHETVYEDLPIGSIKVVGSVIEVHLVADSPKGSWTVSGTAVDGRVRTDAVTGKIELLGSLGIVHSYSDSPTGSVEQSGKVVEGWVQSINVTGTIKISGTSTESNGHETTYTDVPSGVLNFLGSKVSTHIASDEVSGSWSVSGSAKDEGSVTRIVFGNVNVLGKAVDHYVPPGNLPQGTYHGYGEGNYDGSGESTYHGLGSGSYDG